MARDWVQIFKNLGKNENEMQPRLIAEEKTTDNFLYIEIFFSKNLKIGKYKFLKKPF